MANQSSRPLDIALESLDGLIREIKSRNDETSRRRMAFKLRDVVVVCHRGMLFFLLLLRLVRYGLSLD